MTKFIRNVLPAIALLSGSLALFADTDAKLVTATEQSSGEQLAKLPVRGFTAPRMKQGLGANIVSSTSTSAPIVVNPQSTTSRKTSSSFEYVPDLKGMVVSGMTTALNTLSLDGSMTAVTGVSSSIYMGVLSGGCGSASTYYTSVGYVYPYFSLYYAFAYSTETWTQLNNYAPYSVTANCMSTDLTYDESTETIYGCFLNSTGDGYEFGTVDFVAGDRTTIATLPAAWNAIAATKDGKIYAIDMTGKLLSVDKTSGATTEIGSTGYTPVNISSATIDRRTNKMYWTVSTDDAGFLCEVDLTTGEATKLADFPNNEEVYALYIQAPAAEDMAPAAPTNLALQFPKGTLTGHITFDAPTTLFRGAEATGSVNYRVVASDGTQLVSGTTTYGATSVDTPDFTLSEPGQYTLRLYCSNDVGDSPKAEISGFIGEDAPQAVTNATAVYNDGVFTISWTAPTKSANGGYIDPEAITYTVTRLPDNTVVATTKETTVTDEVAMPETYTSYKYTIVAEYNTWKSATATTNSTGLGQIVPPFSETFDDSSYLERFAAYDGDGDSRSWGSFLGMAAGYGTMAADKPTDDWLFTPNMKLEAGKFYKLSLNAATMSTSWTNSFEVKIGTAPSAESMTRTIIETSSVSTTGYTDKVPFSEYFSVPEDGVYNIGIHHNTESYGYFLLIDDFEISEPMEGAAPGVITDLVITPDPNGGKKATFTFKAPATDLNGEDLPYLEKIVVTCNEETIHTVESPKPGAEVTFTQEFEKSGDFTFAFTAYNGSTAGRTVEQVAHIGYDVPSAPAKLTAVATGKTGEVALNWSAVTTDIKGKNISNEDVKYILIRINGTEQTIIANNLTSTSYTYQAFTDEDTDQEFYQFAVSAFTEVGYSGGTVSDMLVLGAPYTIPYEESFANGGLSYIMAAMTLSGSGSWQTYGDQSFSMGVKSYDSDNGMIGMYGPSVGDAARIFTGKIDFTKLKNPTLTFYTFNLQSDASTLDLNEISIKVNVGDGYEEVEKIVVNDVANGVRGWAKVTVDLSDYAGETVQIAFDAETKVYLYTLIDKLSIFERYPYDLAITSISAPQTAELDEEFDVTVNVENVGLNASGSYKVILYNNSKAIAEVERPALAVEGTDAVSFPITLNATDQESNLFDAELVYDADENEDNNISESVKTRLRHTGFPTVSNLSIARSNDSQVELTWDVPEKLSSLDESVTETFEDADTETTFPTEYGNWTFLDEDKGYIGGIRNVELPGIQTGSQQSYWVMDDSNEVFGGNTSYQAHSGHKYLAQMYTMDLSGISSVQCDDWVISPWLYEKAQTISFYAKSYGTDTNERFQFLYSTDGTDVDDFTLVETVASVPNAWTEYEFEIPDGAKYFAIRCTSTFQYMLFIDDITYIPANGSNLKLEGYNVYVDGKQINNSLITTTGYTDTSDYAKTNETIYGVSAVYSAGESKTAITGLAYTGLDDLLSETISVVGSNGKVIVKGAQGQAVSLFSVDGKMTYAGVAKAYTEIPAFAGVYVATVGNKTYKVLVK